MQNVVYMQERLRKHGFCSYSYAHLLLLRPFTYSYVPLLIVTSLCYSYVPFHFVFRVCCLSCAGIGMRLPRLVGPVTFSGERNAVSGIP